MGFFGRNRRPEGENPDEFNKLQAYEDQVIESQKFLSDLLLDQDVASVHPWDASDPQQLQAGLAATAYALDRAAEYLMQAGLTTAGADGHGVPAVLEGFANPLTHNALTRLEQARLIDPKTDDFEFSEEAIEKLHPEMQLPAWPRYPDGAVDTRWQAAEAPAATRTFLRAIIEAGEELHVQTFDTVQRFQLKVIQPVPDDFDGFADFVAQQLCDPANEQLQAAKEYAYASDGSETDMTGTTSYDLVHDGYIGMMLAYVGVHAPRTLTN